MFARTKIPLATLAVLASAASAELTIRWFSIDSGGCRSLAAGPFSISCTVGQPDASQTQTTGPFTFTGGYWAGAIAPCPSDFDGSGFVDTDDFTAFVVAFGEGTDNADFDGSGFVDTDDFTAFVLAFEAGC